MLRSRLLSIAAAFGLFAALPTQASDAGLDFNGHSFNVFADTALGRFVPNAANAEVGAGFLFDSQNDGDHLKFLHADLLATGSLGVPGATGGIGLRGFYGNREHFSGGGAAIGGRMAYYFPQYNRLGLSGYLWYSPNVLTGGNFQHYFEYGLDINYQVLQQATVYAGYRRLTLPVEGPEANIRARAPNQGLHAGIRISF